MSAQQYHNLNLGQDLTFLVPFVPNNRLSEMSSCGIQMQNENNEVGQVRVCTRGHWRPHEDAKLKELVALHGPQNWNLIAQKLHGRSGKSCRLRWFNQLEPRINKRSFNQEEEDRLLAAHQTYGNKWAIITRLFPGRTDNAVKNHWHVIMARRHREQNSIYHRRKPSASLATSSPSKQPVACCVNVDRESVSTCTELSLSPSSPGFGPYPFLGFSQFGSSTEKTNLNVTNVVSDRFYHMPTTLASNQSGNSGSNSEFTASDSVVTNMCTPNNLLNEKEESIVPFFDFLGLGLTN